MQRGSRSKVVHLRRRFLGMGEARRHQRTINRMGRHGYRYVEAVRRWSGVDLVFIKDAAHGIAPTATSQPSVPPPPPR